MTDNGVFVPLPSDPALRERSIQILRRVVEGPTPEEQAETAARAAESRQQRRDECAAGLAAWVAEMARHPSGSLEREIVSLHCPVYLDEDQDRSPCLECRGCAPWLYEIDDGEWAQGGQQWPCATYELVARRR